MFPKVPDQHKNGKPLVPNGLGVLYVLFTIVYLFLFYFLSENYSVQLGISAPLTLAVCVLFGGFMGLLDDWMDLKWRYKAFMPLIAALLVGGSGERFPVGSLDFSVTYCFRPHHGPGVDSAPIKNEYQEHFLWVKLGSCVTVMTLPPSCDECHKNLGA